MQTTRRVDFITFPLVLSYFVRSLYSYSQHTVLCNGVLHMSIQAYGYMYTCPLGWIPNSNKGLCIILQNVAWPPLKIYFDVTSQIIKKSQLTALWIHKLSLNWGQSEVWSVFVWKVNLSLIPWLNLLRTSFWFYRCNKIYICATLNSYQIIMHVSMGGNKKCQTVSSLSQFL